jgi:hypothetical protein
MAVITLAIGGYIVKREGTAASKNHVSRLYAVSGFDSQLHRILHESFNVNV